MSEDERNWETWNWFKVKELISEFLQDLDSLRDLSPEANLTIEKWEKRIKE